jgi:hypothetical protein
MSSIELYVLWVLARGLCSFEGRTRHCFDDWSYGILTS